MERVLELQTLENGMDTQAISTVSPAMCGSSVSIIFCVHPSGHGDERGEG